MEHLRSTISKQRFLTKKYHKLLTGAFRRRMLGDYDEVARFASDEVMQILEQARDFLSTAKEYLAKES